MLDVSTVSRQVACVAGPGADPPGPGPIWGKLSDLHGRKIMFQSAIGLFLVSLAAGFAQNMVQLISARGIQGLGVGA